MTRHTGRRSGAVDDWCGRGVGAQRKRAHASRAQCLGRDASRGLVRRAVLKAACCITLCANYGRQMRGGMGYTCEMKTAGSPLRTGWLPPGTQLEPFVSTRALPPEPAVGGGS